MQRATTTKPEIEASDARASQPTSVSGDPQSHVGSGHIGRVLALQQTIGNRAVQRLLVQRRGAGDPPPDVVHRAALQGIASGGGALPHFDRIQAAFGIEHDLSGVRAHVGGQARAAADAMGARAYATGEHIAFQDTPSLWVAAHEAAHVVQQRGGVQLSGGVGALGDRYERHADSIADRVVAGQSASALLGGFGASSSGPVEAARPGVQMVKLRLTTGVDIDTQKMTELELKDAIAAETDPTISAQLEDAFHKGDFKGAKKLSRAALKRAVDAEHEAQDWDFATGHSGSGKWTPDVTVRGAHSFAGDRVRQVLRHISTALYYYAKARVDKEQEVQAMLVGEQLFVSSNDPASMKLFQGLDANTMLGILLSASETVDKSEQARYQGDINKLCALVAGKRLEEITDDDEEREMLVVMQKAILGAVVDPATHVQVCDIDAAAGLIGQDVGNLIFVTGLDGAHAEQNLIIAYAQSGSALPAHIYGKKRPCTGCYLTFRYATQILKLEIYHNHMPGGFWGPAVEGLFALMARTRPKIQGVHDFVEAHLPDMTYRTASGTDSGDHVKPRTNQARQSTGYDSASDTEAEDADVPMNVAKEKYKSAFDVVEEEDDQQDD